MALLSPNSPAVAWTSGSTCPDAFITDANPCAVIMMKPIRAIMRMPEVNTSSASRRRTTPVAMKMKRPTRAPTSSGSALDPVTVSQDWMAKLPRIATTATITFGRLISAGALTSIFALGS